MCLFLVLDVVLEEAFGNRKDGKRSFLLRGFEHPFRIKLASLFVKVGENDLYVDPKAQISNPAKAFGRP